MVRGVPLFVFRWDPSKGLFKPVHTMCPLWVKLHNIPLVEFTTEGISRIASVLGVPIQWTRALRPCVTKHGADRVLLKF